MPPKCETCQVVEQAERMVMTPLEARITKAIDTLADKLDLWAYKLAQVWYGR